MQRPRRLVAIHQPNFFPWLGYFDKIARADVFVFLDAVQYPRTGSGGMGSYVNRVEIADRGRRFHLRAPVSRMPLDAAICDARTDDRQPWRRKIVETLKQTYARSPGRERALALLTPLVENPEPSLASYNIAAVRAIAAALGLATEFVTQSSLGVDGRANELLIALARAVGADAYLTGGGAAGYLEPAAFEAAGLGLVRQDFVPFAYGAADDFEPGLSVVDFLMRTDDWPAPFRNELSGALPA